MRVLAIVPSFFGSTGDAVNERQLLMALARKVEKCYIITFVGFRQLFVRRRELKVNFPENMTVIPLPIPQVNLLVLCFAMICVSCLASIVSLMFDVLKKIDLIYIRNSFLSIGFLTFYSLARKTVVKIPAIVEDEVQNEGITKSLIKKVASFTDSLVLGRAKKTAVNSRLLYNELVRRRRFKHKDEPLEIPAGVDLDLIKKVKSKTKEASARNAPNIGFLGSIAWWQGVDILIRAMSFLKGDFPNLKLLLIGDGELRPIAEKVCREMDVPYEITGFLPHEEALKRLSMLDVLVLPSRKISTTELNIPIKVIEAWALGVPVIVTEHRVFRHLGIRNWEDIIFCKPEAKSVAEAVSAIMNNQGLREKLQANGPAIARQFSYDVIAEKLLALK